MFNFLILSAIILSPLFIFVPEGRADITTGLQGWWKFDEASGASAADSSGNGNTGTLHSNPTWIAGKIGSALSFNGANYVQLATSMTQTGSFTVAAWVKPNSACLNPTQGCGFIGNSQYQGGGLNGLGYQIGWYSNGAFEFDIEKTGNSELAAASTASYFSPGVWKHVAGVFDGSNMYIYVNGALTATAAATATTGATFPLYIGKVPQGGWTSPQFSGSIDDVRIYNRALSPSDVAQLYGTQTVHISHSHLANFHRNYY